MAKTTTIYRAKRTFFHGASNAPVVEGKDYPPEHPVVKVAPEAFDKIRITVDDDPPVERATAAPGEKRTVRDAEE